MARQPAKQTFTREEIADILRANIEQFRDEPQFDQYLVDLTLYLVDQAYCVSGLRPDDLGGIVGANSNDTGDDQYIADDEKPTNKLSFDTFEAVVKRPPPPILDGEEELDPTTGQLKELHAKVVAGMEDQDVDDSDSGPIMVERDELERHASEIDDEVDDYRHDQSEDETPKTYQLPSIAYMDPKDRAGEHKPEREPEKPPRREDDEEDLDHDDDDSLAIFDPHLGDRARVYHVVPSNMSNKRQRQLERRKARTSFCPVCGASMKGNRVCPSCGHIMR